MDVIKLESVPPERKEPTSTSDIIDNFTDLFKILLIVSIGFLLISVFDISAFFIGIYFLIQFIFYDFKSNSKNDFFSNLNISLKME